MKKQVKILDLCLHACKERQSPKTLFLHMHPQDSDCWDTIPVFENFCFALASFRQKTQESVLFGKELIEKLLQFQTPDGNFPCFLHEYPKAWDPHLSLKIAPIFVHICQDFGSIVSSSFIQKLQQALAKMVIKPVNPIWEHRYLALQGIRPVLTEGLSSSQWFDWIVSDQLFEKNGQYPIPFNSNLQLLIEENRTFEKDLPQPRAIEYMLSEKDGFHARLLQNHPQQIYTSLLYPFSTTKETHDEVLLQKNPLQLFWQGESLLSLVSSKAYQEGNCFVFDLQGSSDPLKDPFEVEIFVTLKPEISLFINQEKSMVFHFQDTVTIVSSSLKIDLVFSLISGKGDFVGHISRANRPGQISCKNSHLYDAFDWHIGLRSLRRLEPCKVQVQMNIQEISS